MFGKRKTEVLVVGAGPVGLFAALMLAERGIEVMIVDEEWRTAGHSYGLAIHSSTLKLLDAEGMATELVKSGIRIDQIALYEGADRHAELTLAEPGSPFPYLTALPQSALESALEERLKQKNIKVMWNHRVSRLAQEGETVAATVDELGKVSSGYAFAKTEWAIEKSRPVEARFVIGADGHRSLVRKGLDIEYDFAGDPDFFAVFEFLADAHAERELKIVLDGDTTNVLWPLPGGRYRWSFQLTEADVSSATRVKSRLSVQIGDHAYPYVTEDYMHTLIRERAPWFQVKIGEIDWSLAIRFERARAASFGKGRVRLAGDAGHLTSPVGGQSMNVGLREAHDLVDRITRILRENGSLDMLDDYNRERKAEWSRLLGIDWALVAGAGADPWITQRAARLLPCLPASGDDLDRLAAQAGLVLQKLERESPEA